MNVSLRAGLVLGVTILAGCSGKSAPTPENFQTGLNKYLPEHRSDCLFDSNQRFPYTTSDAAEQKKLDTLVKAQLLKITKEQGITNYEPTDYGKTGAPLYCYGYREATKVVSSTTPEVKDGFKQSAVVYQYEMKDAPAWAKSEDLQNAFPDLKKNLSGQATGKAKLSQTTIGWQVSDN